MHDQDYKKVMKKLNAWIAENEKPPLPCNLITVDWRKSYEHQLNDWSASNSNRYAFCLDVYKRQGLYKKIHNITEFKASEIEFLTNLLDLKDKSIFFNWVVI